MGKLLKFEYRKLFHQTSFWVCMMVLAGLVLLNEGMYFILTKTASTLMEAEDAAIMIETLGVSDNSGIISLVRAFSECNFEILAAIFVSITVCSDYTQNTIRNIITKGYTRTQIFVSKYIVCATGCLIMLLESAVLGGLFGTLFWGVGSADATSVLVSLLAQAFIALAETAVFFAISDLVRKNGGAIALGIIIPMCTTLVSTILTAVARVNFDWNFDFSSIFLSYYTMQSSTIAETAAKAGEMLGKCSIWCAVYLVLSIALAWILGRKKEV